MQNTFLTGIIIALLAIFLKEKKDIPGSFTVKTGSELASLDTSKWYLTRIHRDTGVTEITRKKAFIRFNEAKGSAGGNGSCNSFGSTLKLNGNTISFNDIFSTKMYCEEVQSIEDNFFSQLQKVTRYEVKGKTLLLFAGDDVVLELAK
jgi:heat shock protein HslJ